MKYFTIFGSIEVGVVGEIVGICCEIDETGGCNLGSTFIYSGLVKSVEAPPPGPAVPAGGEVGGREVMLGIWQYRLWSFKSGDTKLT